MVLDSVGGQLQVAFHRLEELGNQLPVDVTSEEFARTLESLGESLLEGVKGFVAGLGEPTGQVAGNFAKGIPAAG